MSQEKKHRLTRFLRRQRVEKNLAERSDTPQPAQATGRPKSAVLATSKSSPTQSTRPQISYAPANREDEHTSRPKPSLTRPNGDSACPIHSEEPLVGPQVHQLLRPTPRLSIEPIARPYGADNPAEKTITYRPEKDVSSHGGSLNIKNSRDHFSEDVADRNSSIRMPRPDGQLPTARRSVDILDHNVPNYPRVVAEKSRYSEEVANRNMSLHSLSSTEKSRHSEDVAERNRCLHSPIITGKSRYSEDVADRNMTLEPSIAAGKSIHSEDVGNRHRRLHSWVLTGKSRYSEEVADRNMSFHSSSAKHARARSHPDRIKSLGQPASVRVRSDTMPSFSKPEMREERHNQEVDTQSLLQDACVAELYMAKSAQSSSEQSGREESNSTSEQHSFPTIKVARGNISSAGSSLRLAERTDRSKPTEPNSDLEPIAAHKLKVAGIDLSHSVDTEVLTRYEPAVSKEVIKPTVHHVRQEQITREIHNYDVYHRILPIRDVQILPARHFIRLENGELQEVPALSIPYATGANQAWQMVETVSTGDEHLAPVPRRFTAREFGEEDLKVDCEERVDADGVRRSRTTWIHPPTLEGGAVRTGQTEPFYFEN